MSIECAYSFRDLFVAAFGREPSERELQRLYELPQRERNKQVSEWAARAGWNVKDKIGADGRTYTAFWPAAAMDLGVACDVDGHAV